MRRCPLCGQTYTDPTINFCLNDGELLSRLVDEVPRDPFADEPPPTRFADDSAPTVILETPRITNQTNWPPANWESQTPVYSGQRYPFAGFNASLDKTMPTVSIILGIASCVFVCCAGGIWLGLPAVVVGFLGLRNADSDPGRYAGRGLAIGGMVLGIITFFASLFFLIFGQLA